MAHDPSRTEKATPKRRSSARKEGSVLRVADLDASILLWGNFFLLLGAGGSTVLLLSQQLVFYLKKAGEASYVSEGNLSQLALDALWILLKLLLPYLGVNLLLALGNQIAQHGLHFNFGILSPKFSKLNPFPGFRRLFSARSVFEITKSLFKFLVMAWAAYAVLGPRMQLFMETMNLPLNQSLTLLQQVLFQLYRNVMLAMLALALGDFLYQKYTFEKGMRMTKQEVKEEAKDAEGSPEIKGKQRSLMLATFIQRIRTQVPKATVVITNPTHFAVALRYDQDTAAPICVAKGVDHLALQIREKAKASGVPLVENPPLARSLYRSVDLDQPIPPELYQAVAQILAFVMRAKGAA